MISDLLLTATVWMGKLGYTGVFISTVGILPAELVITMVSASKPDQTIQIAIIAALGEVVGALWTYAIGYYFKDKDILYFLTKGKGKFLKITEGSFEKSNGFVRKNGFFYILLTRFTPGLRVAVLLVAGYLKYNLIPTSIAVFIGTFIYAYGFAYLGSEIGFNWFQIMGIIDTVNNVLVFLTLVILGLIGYKNRKSIKKIIKKLFPNLKNPFR